MNIDKLLELAERAKRARAEMDAVERELAALGRNGATRTPPTQKSAGKSSPRKPENGSVSQRIKKHLAANGPGGAVEIAEALKANPGTVKTTLAKSKAAGELVLKDGKYDLAKK